MSATASFYVIARADLATLVEAGEDLYDALTDNAEELDDAFPWSGYAFLHLMSLREDRNVYVGGEYPDVDDALAAEAGFGAFVLTPAAFSDVDDLNPQRFSDEEIRHHFAELGLDFEEAGTAGKDGLQLLSAQLVALNLDQALVVTVG